MILDIFLPWFTMLIYHGDFQMFKPPTRSTMIHHSPCGPMSPDMQQSCQNSSANFRVSWSTWSRANANDMGWRNHQNKLWGARFPEKIHGKWWLYMVISCYLHNRCSIFVWYSIHWNSKWYTNIWHPLYRVNHDEISIGPCIKYHQPTSHRVGQSWT